MIDLATMIITDHHEKLQSFISPVYEGDALLFTAMLGREAGDSTGRQRWSRTSRVSSTSTRSRAPTTTCTCRRTQGTWPPS